MKAIHLKSFDYRVLNLLMYQLTGRQVGIPFCSLFTINSTPRVTLLLLKPGIIFSGAHFLGQ
jgi:hypothetical protein